MKICVSVKQKTGHRSFFAMPGFYRQISLIIFGFAFKVALLLAADGAAFRG